MSVNSARRLQRPTVETLPGKHSESNFAEGDSFEKHLFWL